MFSQNLTFLYVFISKRNVKAFAKVTKSDTCCYCQCINYCRIRRIYIYLVKYIL